MGKKLRAIGDVRKTTLCAVDVGSVKGWTFSVILDKSIAEVFLNDGIQAGTMDYLPHKETDEVAITSLQTHENTKVAVGISGLE